MTVLYDTAQIGKLTQDASTGMIHIKDVPIARNGVFPYLKKDGSIAMEAKLPSELQSAETVASANNKPVTDNHPGVLVTTKNANKYMKGITASNAHVDGNKIKVDMTLADQSLIDDVKKGKQELSIGFTADIVPEKGEYSGVKYDAVQRNIRINHIAVVDRGRAGHSIQLLGDSAQMMTDVKKGKSMDVTKMHLNDGSDISVAVEDADKVSKLDAGNTSKAQQIANLKNQIADLQAQLAKLQGNADQTSQDAKDQKAKADAATAKNDALEKKLKDLQDSIDDKVQERLGLIDEAKPYLGDSYDFKGKSAKQFMLDAIHAVNDSYDGKDATLGEIHNILQGIEMGSKTPKVVGAKLPKAENDSEDEAAALKLRYERYHMNERRDN